MWNFGIASVFPPNKPLEAWAITKFVRVTMLPDTVKIYKDELKIKQRPIIDIWTYDILGEERVI